MIGHLAALDRLVDGRVALAAHELDLLVLLEDELGVQLVGPGAAATSSARLLAGPARSVLRATHAFFQDAERLAEELPLEGQVLDFVRPALPLRPRARPRFDAC